MTVCIAAIAEQGRAIVLVADRAISAVRGGQTALKADSGARKIRELRRGWAGLISGPIDFGEQVLYIANTSNAAASGTRIKATAGEIMHPMGMPECAKIAYQTCRKVLVVDQILRPRLLDEEWYNNKVAGQISKDDSHFAAIAKEIGEAIVESSILICGFENGTPEIYIVSDPGILNSASAEGFGVVGIGEDAARSRLFTLETDPSDELGKVLYDAYDAKESCAELLPEVGHEWDASILVSGKPAVPVPDEMQELIEKLYTGHAVSPFDKQSARPKGWRKRLQEFATEALRQDHEPTPLEMQPRSWGAQRDDR